MLLRQQKPLLAAARAHSNLAAPHISHHIASHRPARAATTAVAAAAKRGGRRGGRGSSQSDGLSQVLKDELKIEKERYRQSEEVAAGPPEPWELIDQPNTNALILQRTYHGDEEVVLEVDLDEQSDGGEDDEDEDDYSEGETIPPVRFTVNISKGEAVLTFQVLWCFVLRAAADDGLFFCVVATNTKTHKHKHNKQL